MVARFRLPSRHGVALADRPVRHSVSESGRSPGEGEGIAWGVWRRDAGVRPRADRRDRGCGVPAHIARLRGASLEYRRTVAGVVTRASRPALRGLQVVEGHESASRGDWLFERVA